MANEDKYHYIDIELYAYLRVSKERIQEAVLEQATQEALDKLNIEVPGELRVPETYENESLFEELNDELPENMYTNAEVIKVITNKSSNTDAKSLLELLDID